MARTNLITNPSLETNVTGWTPALSTGTTQTPIPAGTKYGFTSGATDITNTFVPVIAGQPYVGSASCSRDNAGTVQAVVDWYDAGSVLISTSAGSAPSIALDTWTRVSASGTAPATATQAQLRLVYGGTSGRRVDAALLEQSAGLGSYFDGDTAGASWSGTAHASTSTLPDPVPALTPQRRSRPNYRR